LPLLSLIFAEIFFMRIIKGALISFCFIFLLITLISLLMPSRVRISRAADFHNAPASLQSYISNLSNWNCWLPALRAEGIGISFPAHTSGPGAVLQTAATSIRINSSTPGAITFTMLQQGDSITGGFTILPGRTADSAVVQWYFDQRFKWYPWQKFKALFSEKIIGSGMEEGLDSLKRCME
jgi:hypothetical protein